MRSYLGLPDRTKILHAFIWTHEASFSLVAPCTFQKDVFFAPPYCTESIFHKFSCTQCRRSWRQQSPQVFPSADVTDSFAKLVKARTAIDSVRSSNPRVRRIFLRSAAYYSQGCSFISLEFPSHFQSASAICQTNDRDWQKYPLSRAVHIRSGTALCSRNFFSGSSRRTRPLPERLLLQTVLICVFNLCLLYFFS